LGPANDYSKFWKNWVKVFFGYDLRMKIFRIYQPANPLFWILLVLNLLSMALSYIAQNYTLNSLGSLLVIAFAVINAVISAWLAWRLINS
jgi:hypothetical protein